MTVQKPIGFVATGLCLGLLIACSSSTPEASGDGGSANTVTPPPGADGGSSSCQVGDTSSYSYAAPGPANALFSNQCTPAQVDTFLSQCLVVSSTPPQCLAWQTSAGACGSCLLTARDAPKTGAFFATADGAFSDINLEGCLDHFAPGCGPAYVDYFSCIDFACGSTTNCSDAGADQLGACQLAATKGPCLDRSRAFATKCQGAIDLTGTGVPASADTCFSPGPADKAYFEHFSLVFCGTAAEADAGSPASPVDAAADAPSDGG